MIREILETPQLNLHGQYNLLTRPGSHSYLAHAEAKASDHSAEGTVGPDRDASTI